MRVAIVGSGISGLVAAHLLHPRHEICVYEAEDRIGGHAHTVDVEVDGERRAIDTGFIVYNERTYPNFTRLLGKIGAETLRRWRRRMFENIDGMRALGLDERFLRMWEFYLCYCEAGFEERQVGVVQVVFEKSGARRASVLGKLEA